MSWWWVDVSTIVHVGCGLHVQAVSLIKRLKERNPTTDAALSVECRGVRYDLYILEGKSLRSTACLELKQEIRQLKIRIKFHARGVVSIEISFGFFVS